MKKTYQKERKEVIEQNKSFEVRLFSEEMVSHLPEQIKKYLSVCGYMNTPIPINADIHWAESYLKLSPEKKWHKLKTLQFNSINPVVRVGYFRFLSIPLQAKDIYRDGYAESKIKLFNLFKVHFDNSTELAKAWLITSLCEFLIAPGYVLSTNVKWENLTENSVRATLIDNGIVVSGVFYFDDNGLFTCFKADERYFFFTKVPLYTGKKYKNAKFSIIVDSYKNQGNIKILESARVMWNLPEGNFEYYKGVIDKIEFNVSE